MNAQHALTVLIAILLFCFVIGAHREASAESAPLPTETVDWQKGKVYKAQQAVRDPVSGVVVRLNGVQFDGSRPGLESGQQWALIDLTIANGGERSITLRPLGDLGIRTDNDSIFLTEPPGVDAVLDSASVAQLLSNSQIQPGEGIRGLLAVRVPAGAKNRVLWYARGLILRRTPSHYATMQFSLEP